MIHTFEIQYRLNKTCATYCTSRLNQIGRDYGAVNGKIRYHSNTETNSFLNGSTSFLIYRMEHIALGLHHIKLIKMQDDNTLPDYYIRFRVEPEVLLTQQYSLNLFQCNENNYDALQARYAKIIYRLFPTVFDHRPIINAYDIMSDAERIQFHHLESNGRCLMLRGEELSTYEYRYLYSLPYLALAKVVRVDYTLDFHCDHPDLYLELAKKSFCDTGKIRKDRNQSEFLAAYNKTATGFVIYDKHKKYMLPRYDEKPHIEELRQAAVNVMRIEFTFKSKDRQQQIKFTRMNIPSGGRALNTPIHCNCGLMPFIIKDLGSTRLREEYYKHVGGGQWVSDYYFEKTVNESSLTENTKRKLYLLAYLVSEVRHLDRSEAAYIRGRDIQRFRGEGSIRVQGSKQTYRKYVALIHSLGLQPLRIPDSRKITHVSSEYDSFIAVDVGAGEHPIIEIPFEIYNRTIADFKALYNRYK